MALTELGLPLTVWVGSCVRVNWADVWERITVFICPSCVLGMINSLSHTHSSLVCFILQEFGPLHTDCTCCTHSPTHYPSLSLSLSLFMYRDTRAYVNSIVKAFGQSRSGLVWWTIDWTHCFKCSCSNIYYVDKREGEKQCDIMVFCLVTAGVVYSHIRHFWFQLIWVKSTVKWYLHQQYQ